MKNDEGQRSICTFPSTAGTGKILYHPPTTVFLLSSGDDFKDWYPRHRGYIASSTLPKIFHPEGIILMNYSTNISNVDVVSGYKTTHQM